MTLWQRCATADGGGEACSCLQPIQVQYGEPLSRRGIKHFGVAADRSVHQLCRSRGTRERDDVHAQAPVLNTVARVLWVHADEPQHACHRQPRPYRPCVLHPAQEAVASAIFEAPAASHVVAQPYGSRGYRSVVASTWRLMQLNCPHGE